MAGKCKSCESVNRELIDDRLKRGDTPESIAAYLKSKGELISPPSIRRHLKSHVDGVWKEPENEDDPLILSQLADSESGDPFIDTEAALKRIENEMANSDVFESVVYERQRTQLLLEKILQKQLLIVHELQIQYTEGHAGYPDSQIRGLKTLMDSINSLPVYSDKQLLSKMKVDLQDKYFNLIIENARETARMDCAGYKTWAFCKRGYASEEPSEIIEKYAAKVHPLSELSRHEWIKTASKKWREIYDDNITEQMHDDKHILINCIGLALEDGIDFIDESTRQKLIKEIVKTVIKTYRTPENAIEHETEIDEISSDLVKQTINEQYA